MVELTARLPYEGDNFKFKVGRYGAKDLNEIRSMESNSIEIFSPVHEYSDNAYTVLGLGFYYFFVLTHHF